MKAIFFDLDGTLLPMDVELFMKVYFDEMSKLFEGLLEKEDLINAVMKATGTMVRDLSDRTNETVFMETFKHLMEADITQHQALFEAFYETTYEHVKISSHVSHDMVEAIKLIKEKGYKIVLVTNPLFPEKAIISRIKWAGLAPEDFDYISSFEQNHYCKPQLLFYEEVLKDNNLEAKDCLMVGNDVQEDMIVAQLGMDTYLLDEHLMHRTDEEVDVTYRGGHADFLAFVKTVL